VRHLAVLVVHRAVARLRVGVGWWGRRLRVRGRT
jgi:hypothetical protein